MTDTDAMLAAVLCEPDDDTPRLAYADRLDDTAEDAAQRVRAAFIRTQVALARLPPMPPQLRASLVAYLAGGSSFQFTATAADFQPLLPLLAGAASPLVYVSARNGAGGEVTVWGYVHEFTRQQAGSVEFTLRAVQRPQWCVDRFLLEKEEGQLYDQGGAACWPDLREEKDKKDEYGPSPIGQALQAAFNLRAAVGDAADRGDVVSRMVERVVTRELERSGPEQPAGYMRPWENLAGRSYVNMQFPSLPKVRFERGFVEEVRATEAEFLREAGLWFAHQPIRKVILTDKQPNHVSVFDPWVGWERGTGQYRPAGTLPPSLWDDLNLPSLDRNRRGVWGGSSADFQIVRAALERACRRYGRRSARTHALRIDPCPSCNGAGCRQHRHQHGLRRLRCDGSGAGVIRSQGLPYYAGDE